MRGCGVLLHISSLPGRGGVGTFGSESHSFIDFLADAGQVWWQVLPLTPPAQGNSPYSSYSVFAGNPAFISLEMLEQEGLLAYWARKFLPRHAGERANFEFCNKVQIPMLRQSFQNGYPKNREAVETFRVKNRFWLEDYALFMALKKQQDGAPFHSWPRPLLLREPDALAKAGTALREEVDFWVWVQYLFFKQWKALKKHAGKHGVGLIGDMPLYPNIDSADVWANPEVFQLDAGRMPTAVAGVPPDAFTADGQLWGNPLYNWESLRADGYRWWLERLGLAGRMYDRTRLDHFRGLDEYFAIPAGASTAREGEWREGPGMHFLREVREQLPQLRLIAEDLGIITDGVRELLRESGLPGMKVLQFAFDPVGDSDYLPHNFIQNCVGYTGTHDNDTLVGWLRSAPPLQLEFARDYLKLDRHEALNWGFIRGLYATTADLVIVPMQDFLALDSRARMNLPGSAEGNWGWRVNGSLLTERLAARMRELAALYRRLPLTPPNT